MRTTGAARLAGMLSIFDGQLFHYSVVNATYHFRYKVI